MNEDRHPRRGRARSHGTTFGEVDGATTPKLTEASAASGTGFRPSLVRSAHYDTDGNLLWERSYNGAASLDDELRGVAAGPNGEVYVCGFERTEPQQEIFVRRYDAAGVIEWTDSGPGDAGEGGRCFGMARDQDDNLVVVGDERIEGVRHILVRKYDPDGEVLWSTLVSGEAGGPDYARDVTITADNEILVTGTLDQGTDARDVWVGRFTP